MVQILEGTATQVRESTITLQQTSNDVFMKLLGNSHEVEYCSWFLLNNQPVQIKLRNPIYIHEDDQIRLVGSFALNQIFVACAYHNLTCRISGKKGWWAFCKEQAWFISQALLGILLSLGLFLLPGRASLLLTLIVIVIGATLFIHAGYNLIRILSAEWLIYRRLNY